ncbi:MAG: hypothetical protein K2P78_12550 [Gemmataceae bacterium]|nr:hypothetical protein [Gemmataceae bacterium]
MATPTEPHLEPGGTQVYPIISATLPGHSSYPGATGEIRWSPNEGLTFTLDLPHDPDHAAVPQMRGAEPRPQPGRFCEVPDQPAWTGTIAGGGEFRLFSPKGSGNTIHKPGTAGYVSHTVLKGRAAFAEVEVAKASPLSFWHDTPVGPRHFLAGLHMTPWPHGYSHRIDLEGGGYHQRGCGCLILAESPKLQLIIRSDECAVPDGLWMSFEGEAPANIRMPADICEDARAFVSFLVGRSIPFLWTDRFLDGTKLVRLFHGHRRPVTDVVGNEQPLPLGHLADSVTHTIGLAPRLPALFAKFRTVKAEYNIEFISSPVWTAFDSYADDKLTYACVSLERLATAHAEWQKKHPESAPPPNIFLTDVQGKTIRDLFRAALKAVAPALGISTQTVKILDEKRIGNIHAAPNADKLKQVFTDLGVTLSAEENKALGNRNRTLHGNATLEGTSLTEVAAEIKRFDLLRTLINKAMLRLLDYTGPFMDYGDRPADKGFAVKTMEALPQAASTADATAPVQPVVTAQAGQPDRAEAVDAVVTSDDV